MAQINLVSFQTSINLFIYTINLLTGAARRLLRRSYPRCWRLDGGGVRRLSLQRPVPRRHLSDAEVSTLLERLAFTYTIIRSYIIRPYFKIDEICRVPVFHLILLSSSHYVCSTGMFWLYEQHTYNKRNGVRENWPPKRSNCHRHVKAEVIQRNVSPSLENLFVLNA